MRYNGHKFNGNAARGSKMHYQSEYEVGDLVAVKQPCGWIKGKVMSVRPGYQYGGRTWYEVHGTDPKAPMLTTAPASVMKKVA